MLRIGLFIDKVNAQPVQRCLDKEANAGITSIPISGKTKVHRAKLCAYSLVVHKKPRTDLELSFMVKNVPIVTGGCIYST